MNNLASAIKNTELQVLSQRAGGRITNAIHKASIKTGVDFSYLMQQAAAESSFDAKAKASTSSASGLYQFIEKTWLNTVKKHGKEHGLEYLTKYIDDSGNISDKNIKKQILDLRNNPEIASTMAAEFASDNKEMLEKNGVKNIGATELYFAHFLGAKGASKFLLTRQNNPQTSGAEIFPAAAKANKNVFFNKDGNQRSVDDIYQIFQKKFSIENREIQKPNEVIATNRNYGISKNNIYNSLNIINNNNKQNLFSRPMGGDWGYIAKIFMVNNAYKSHELLLMLQEERGSV